MKYICTYITYSKRSARKNFIRLVYFHNTTLPFPQILHNFKYKTKLTIKKNFSNIQLLKYLNQNKNNNNNNIQNDTLPLVTFFLNRLGNTRLLREQIRCFVLFYFQTLPNFKIYFYKN